MRCTGGVNGTSVHEALRARVPTWLAYSFGLSIALKIIELALGIKVTKYIPGLKSRLIVYVLLVCALAVAFGAALYVEEQGILTSIFLPMALCGLVGTAGLLPLGIIATISTLQDVDWLSEWEFASVDSDPPAPGTDAGAH